MKYWFLILSFLLAFVVTGCENISFLKPKKAVTKEEAAPIPMPAVKGTLIARINNQPVTLEELNQEIDALNSQIAAENPEEKITTRDKKIDYLKNTMVQRVLLYQEALARGFDRKDEVQKALAKAKEDLLVIELLRQETDKIGVSTNEIDTFYEEHKEEMRDPEERQIREIVVATEQEARDINIQLLQGSDFAALARDRSKVSSAKDGGDLGLITKGKKSAQFDMVAFSETLETGKFSSIFKVPEGYCILKLEAKRGGKLKLLSEVRDDIKKLIVFLKQQEKIKELIGKLSRDARKEFYELEIK
jgi:peptidyl-prolyl cis-trans isomerase C